MSEIISNSIILLRAFTVLSCWVLLATASGATVLKFMSNNSVEWLEKYRGEYFIVSFLVGLLSTILLSIGSMISLGLSAGTAAIILICLILTGIPSLKDIISFIRGILSHWAMDLKQHPYFSVFGLLILCSFIVSLSLLSLLPPVSTDELVYHVWHPSHGRYFLKTPEIGEIHSWMPRNIETMFFFLRVLSGDFLASTMFQAVIFFIVMGVMTLFFLNHGHSISIALMISLMCVLSVHAFPRYVPSFLVDSGTHAFIIIFTIMLLTWIKDTNNIPAALAAGLSGGLALGSKYFSLYYITTFLSIAILLSIKREFFTERVKFFKLMVIIGLSIFLGCGFWYLRNLLFTQNPFYPFLFAHPGFSSEEMLRLKQVIARIGTPMNWSFLFAPFLSEYKPYRSFFFIPGYISLGAFFYSKYRKETVALSAAVILLVFMIQSSQIGVYPRYHISLFVLASMLAGYTISGMIQQSRLWKKTGLALLFGIVLINSCMSLYAMRPLTAINYFVGNAPIEEIYRRPSSRVAIEINSMGNDQKYKILTIAPEEFFTFFRPTDNDISMKIHDIAEDDKFDVLSDHEILASFRKVKVTHFLTKDDEGFARQVASRTTLDEFLRCYRVRNILIENSRPIPIQSSANYKLYELKSK